MQFKVNLTTLGDGYAQQPPSREMIQNAVGVPVTIGVGHKIGEIIAVHGTTATIEIDDSMAASYEAGASMHIFLKGGRPLGPEPHFYSLEKK